MNALMMRHITVWKRGVCSTLPIRAAVLPKKVFLPVAVTTASTSPRVTTLPILGSPPTFMVTGSDSPVRALWSTWMVPACTRVSAGTCLPASSFTRSPGTSSAAWMSLQAPSRFTSANGFRLAFSAWTAEPLL